MKMDSESVELKKGAIEGIVENKRPGKEIIKATKIPNLGKSEIVPN